MCSGRGAITGGGVASSSSSSSSETGGTAGVSDTVFTFCTVKKSQIHQVRPTWNLSYQDHPSSKRNITPLPFWNPHQPPSSTFVSLVLGTQPLPASSFSSHSPLRPWRLPSPTQRLSVDEDTTFQLLYLPALIQTLKTSSEFLLFYDFYSLCWPGHKVQNAGKGSKLQPYKVYQYHSLVLSNMVNGIQTGFCLSFPFFFKWPHPQSTQNILGQGLNPRPSCDNTISLTHRAIAQAPAVYILKLDILVSQKPQSQIVPTLPLLPKLFYYFYNLNMFHLFNGRLKR